MFLLKARCCKGLGTERQFSTGSQVYVGSGRKDYFDDF